jgi:hypothetical protein
MSSFPGVGQRQPECLRVPISRRLDCECTLRPTTLDLPWHTDGAQASGRGPQYDKAPLYTSRGLRRCYVGLWQSADGPACSSPPVRRAGGACRPNPPKGLAS